MPNPQFNYIRNPKEIYSRSFSMIREEANLENLPIDLIPLAIRIIHSCGMTDIVDDLAASPQAITVAKRALAAGEAILCDAEMVAKGIIQRRLPRKNPVICTLNYSEVPELAWKLENTRSAAAVELWEEDIEGAIVVIGNAPTALFHLLELLDAGFPKPAVIFGFPVGFVGAAESKQALAADSRGVPFVTLHGRRGGSAIASAAVNSLMQEEQ
ncbi:precorrin isomerase [Rivularia sp. PCC 7116]|uniref:precorrin-8X methylmutase n=1 Tax=Rivularia sp. PCC 7116 TaxID=373994 RepID=UPI00029F086D|nr:precorrin-8X methylmutase [Rivularia sp. PCC 7116]AFY56248.1 precorrin isomerase [Rivularia sp. PCC 7116]